METSTSKLNFIRGLAILFLFSLHLNAQNTNANRGSKTITNSFNLTLQHTTLVVSNFDISKKFYIDVLGLSEKETDWLPNKQMFISLGKNLELHMGEVEGVEISPSDFNHFAISTNNLDGYLSYLKNQGVVYSNLGGSEKFKVYQRSDGVRQTFIQDPDGYWLEINDAN